MKMSGPRDRSPESLGLATRFAVLSLLLLVVSPALAQDPPRIHVTRVHGPITRRAIVRALHPTELRECQHTHMGHPVRFLLTIDPTGVATMSEVSAHEEVRSYVPCVRRYLARLHFEPRNEPTRAHVTVAFQPSAVTRRPP